MAISVSNVVLSDTFDIWRVRTNQTINILNDSTPNATGNTVVLRDDTGNAAFTALDVGEFSSNTVISNNLIVNTSIDFSGATFANTGTIQNIKVTSGTISNVSIVGSSSTIDIPEGEFNTLRVTSTVDFNDAGTIGFGEFSGNMSGGTLAGVTIQRGASPNYTEGNFKYLYAKRVDSDVPEIDFTGADVISLGVADDLTLYGGYIANVNVHIKSSDSYFRANNEFYFENNAIIRAETSTWTDVNYFDFKTNSATSASLLNLEDDSVSTGTRSVVNIKQYKSEAIGTTALKVTSNSGNVLVIANNDTDILKISSDGTSNLTNLSISSELRLTSDQTTPLIVANTTSEFFKINSDGTSNTKNLTVTSDSGDVLVVANSSVNILTITSSGDVLWNGDVSTTNTVNYYVSDPIIQINSGGLNVDSGLLLKNTTGNSYGIFWDKSASEFVLAETNSSADTVEGNITFDSNKYLNLQINKLTVRTTVTELSSSVLKENITPIENSLDIINQLNGVRYDWKDRKEDGTQIGLIAEEVQQVLPELSDGTGVAYSKLVGVLVQGIKELSKKVEQLESKLKD